MLSVSLTSIPLIISGLLITYIGIYVLSKNPRSEVHRGLFYFCLSLVVWLLGYTFMYCTHAPDLALEWARFGFIGIAFIASTNFYFNVKLLKISGKRDILITFFIISVFLAVIGHTPLIYTQVQMFFWGFYPLAGSF